ncbi:MAG: quinohemoprotein amine dehydrogenase subunit beta [Gammaproteobacteria bacterium]|nr:quinohemoprotein amine dehydrogenase subunit beta [Gammaproteobacteria bacterium]MCP5424235.1 quinohemoprotein amine dehydrogenase subunit beta [Gammaproteobacteria bacterium]MCP5458891.1 quinohemoprotein amine dehydrogenase subunit beta [Gammaproteobacteria bacterium]
MSKRYHSRLHGLDVGFVLLAGLICSLPAQAKEYLVAVTRPNQVHLIDAAARKVEHSYTIPGNGIPSAVAVPDDGKVAYICTNRWESISGIDLATGKEVFRANMSSGTERVKSVFAMNVSRDGKQLYVHQSPVQLSLDEYQVEDTRIAVYDTSAGLDAKPARTFPAPRRIALLLPGMKSDRLYALGWDLYAINTSSGAIEKTYPIRDWKRPNYSEPDILSVWLQYEQPNIFSTPYYAVRTDISPDDPSAYKTGLLTFDLAKGTFDMEDFEDTSVVIFSSVVSPTHPNEVYMVYTQLTKMDREQHKVIKRIDLDHTYYAINISRDGKEVYLGGALGNIAVYDTATLERIGNIELPDAANQSVAGVRVVQR